MMNRIRTPYPIPYYAQVASPELTYAIFEEGMDPRSDPSWQQWGALQRMSTRIGSIEPVGLPV